MTVKVRRVISVIEARGWVHQRTEGDHRVFFNKDKGSVTVVSGALGEDVPKGTFGSILRQTGLKKSDFK